MYLDGKPINGFSLTDCPEIFGDSNARSVTWKNDADLSALAGKSVRLLFELKDADLYSFQFTNQRMTNKNPRKRIDQLNGCCDDGNTAGMTRKGDAT
jgi:hypothetical protein